MLVPADPLAPHPTNAHLASDKLFASVSSVVSIATVKAAPEGGERAASEQPDNSDDEKDADPASLGGRSLDPFAGFAFSSRGHLGGIFASVAISGAQLWDRIDYKRVTYQSAPSGIQAIEEPIGYEGELKRFRFGNGAMKGAFEFMDESGAPLVAKRFYRIDSLCTRTVSNELDHILLKLEIARNITFNTFIHDCKDSLKYTPSFLIVLQDPTHSATVYESPHSSRFQSWMVEQDLRASDRTERKVLGSRDFGRTDAPDALEMKTHTFLHYVYDSSLKQSKKLGNRDLIMVPGDIQGFLEQAAPTRTSKRSKSARKEPGVGVFHHFDCRLRTAGGQSEHDDGEASTINNFCAIHEDTPACKDLKLSSLGRTPAPPPSKEGSWGQMIADYIWT
ncbi:uncharacterized protein MKK02DRAFT_45424 [Dioszegia hungarica]|uniref:Uncharacterized protein n=1 Tax=Dioszegia hungarica TaxID=4972 RepID=A0AA38LWJ0_9TREE|nr:uncharacterized protein MKK02DRAFT_45424 [Dioszegia hungarica]KAI9636719.1 hypothetical protein MKK02DRAFT_45424 [Dioszegia hungarica]